jgi:hypothetical protein
MWILKGLVEVMFNGVVKVGDRKVKSRCRNV